MSKIKHIMEQAFENELKELDKEIDEMEEEAATNNWDWLVDGSLDTD